ncbi:TadE/TadG family type IV pilus assembly protein [Massilia sp. CF038]|uniref:TadE/TadG family type IV pilus assembly protein n=1 Tax=Massilia sp. CF038 TaxID=1881045 RepID=UPI000917FE91|nr:TadE/TadG family type IV pilus assembly protein [Massilia sp. CF038]SHG50424.1 TadE-like protein [Massilia sp. CF038]
MNLHPTRSRGGAVIEFALILTLLVTIVAGILEFGRAFWYYDALSKATRNAARTLSVAAPATIASSAVAKARSEVSDAAASAGVGGFGTSNVSVACLDSAFNAVTCTDGTAPAGVRVSITGYSMFLGSTIPFLVGAEKTYTVNLAPGTTMPYMR